MDEEIEICPICTLYLRPGISLKSHLNSHPKQKVIETLVNLMKVNRTIPNFLPSEIPYQPQIANRALWNQPATSVSGIPIPNSNHSFIYQQFMSSSQPSVTPQYITIPTVFNSPIMYPPYVYQQQQQVFMSSSGLPPNMIEPKSPAIDLSLRENVSENQQNDMIYSNEDNGELSKKDALDDIVIDEHEIEPLSPVPSENYEDDYIKIRQDLNKACQTRDDEEEDTTIENCEYYSNEINSVQASDPMVLCNDYIGDQVDSHIQNFEHSDERGVMMDVHVSECEEYASRTNLTIENFQEDGLSQQSASNLSIRADEHMPPRGELSEQESNGATSDTTWNHHIQSNANVATSCDLFAHETWQGSEGSDCEEVPPLRNPEPPCNDELDDTPTIISVTAPPLNFKCPTCGQGFNCPKERKAHQAQEHNKKSSGLNLIGANVPSRNTVKKLVIKPKRTALEIKIENTFEELFSSKLSTAESMIDPLLLDTPNVENKCNIVEDINRLTCFECTVCSTTYTDMRSLRTHRQTVHGFRNRYRCDTCGELMKDREDFMEHLKKHPLECKLCGKYFYRRQNIQLHMKRHLGIKPYVCEFCEKQFFSKQKLQEHRNVHTGNAPIKCNMCDDTFRRHSNLIQHRNIHHHEVGRKTKDYICHCGEVLHSKKKLAWHKEIHDAKPKACTKCSEKFVHMASLTRHIRRSHNERFVPEENRNDENVECPICKNVYLKASLDAHIRRHNGGKDFMCSICNKEFSTKWNLKLHKWLHASRATKPFKCDHCKAAFIRESEFTAHMNSHKCVRPYTCNHCGAQFIRKSNCQRHVKEHESEKTFTCQVCAKAFHRSYYLKDHMRIHNGVRPFACHICGKTSTSKSNHNKHVMIHHAKEPVSTEN